MKQWLVAALLCCVVTGCATINPMAIDKNSKMANTSAKSVVLMTVDVFRSDNSRYVPEPFVVKLEKPNAQDKADRQNFKFGKEAGSFIKDGHSVYLVSMALAPGEYVLENVTGKASAFPINSLFEVPLRINFTVRPNSIAYVGHVTAMLRPRIGGELRAGSVIPLIDQAITGISTSTWDISISDHSAEEVALFRNTYPALANVTIDDVQLPAFDRVAVQRWWDGSQQTAKTAVASGSQPLQAK